MFKCFLVLLSCFRVILRGPHRISKRLFLDRGSLSFVKGIPTTQRNKRCMMSFSKGHITQPTGNFNQKISTAESCGWWGINMFFQHASEASQSCQIRRYAPQSCWTRGSWAAQRCWIGRFAAQRWMGSFASQMCWSQVRCENPNLQYLLLSLFKGL